MKSHASNIQSNSLMMPGVQHIETPSKSETERVAKEIDGALSSIGFVYLINHGIPQHLVQFY